MKKLFIIAVVAASAATVMFAGCKSGKTADKNETSLKTFDDSVAYYYGRVVAAGLLDDLQADSDAMAKFDKKEFVAGLDSAFSAASETDIQSAGMALHTKVKSMPEGDEKNKEQWRLAGMGQGFQLVVYLNQMEAETAGKYDKQLTLKGMKEIMLADSKIDIKADSTMLASLNQRLKQKAMQNQQKVRESQSKTAAANEKAGREYIEKEMKNDKTLKQTESGLVYKVIKEGKGACPTADQTACVRYEGRHISGEVFDNGQGQVQEFPVNRVVAGFSEGLQLMRPGAKYRLYIPGRLGYGEQGTPGGPIGPNETLVFDVELVSVK